MNCAYSAAAHPLLSCSPALPRWRQSRLTSCLHQMLTMPWIAYRPAPHSWRLVTGAAGGLGPSTNATRSTLRHACLQFQLGNPRRTRQCRKPATTTPDQLLPMFAARPPACQKLLCNTSRAPGNPRHPPSPPKTTPQACQRPAAMRPAYRERPQNILVGGQNEMSILQQEDRPALQSFSGHDTQPGLYSA